MSIPDNTIGYGAAVLPHLDEFQGFFLVDHPSLHREAVQMQMLSLAATPNGVVGALQAAVVEGVVTKNWHLVGVAALALHGVTKKPYFWIEARKAEGGTFTQMHELEARSIQAAQIEINNLPLVLAMKERLRKDMKKRKQ